MWGEGTDRRGRVEGGGYRVVAQIGYFQGIEATEETTKGWRNLEVTKAGRDSDDRIDTSVETYVWDGETYVRSR